MYRLAIYGQDFENKIQTRHVEKHLTEVPKRKKLM
jgi:hypothetical protein